VTAHRSAATVAQALVVIGLLCVGCTRPSTGANASAVAPSAARTEPPTPTESLTAPTALASLSIGPSIEPPKESPVADPAIPEPPAAWIAVEGGDPVVGELGSFSWQNSGSDSPWLPGNPIHVGAGEQLRLTLAEPVRIVDWHVSRQPPRSTLDGFGAFGMGEGSAEPVTFAAPPRGSWSVNVDVWFADNLGSAAYYWLITVD
jgi:hypothetical protein